MKKLLALVCVIAMLGALCIPTMAAADRIPVVAEVPSDWTTAYLYAWGGSETMTWPGVPMTLIDDWYVAYMNDDNANIIITNGTGAQTADLAVDPGMPVCVFASDIGNASVEPELPIEVPAEADMPKPATDKIYAFVPAGWTTVNLYAWTADASGSNAGWPGVPMTQDENGLWVGELNPGYANIIINDGGAQTVDLPYKGGDAWVLLCAEGTEGGKFKASVLTTDPVAYEHPDPDKVIIDKGPIYVSDVWYVAGTMNGWTNPDEAYMMTANGDGTFTFTMSLTAGDHQLKVTDGTWDHSVGDDNGPEGNYGFNMSADGDVTVNYDGNTAALTVEGEFVGPWEGKTVDNGVWYVAGTMNEWNCCDEAYKMTANGDGTYSYTFAVTPGDYQLKITNGTWDVCYGDPNGPEGNYAFNVTDETNCVVKFDSNTTEVSHEFTGEPVPPTTEPPTTQPTGGDKEPEESSNTGLIISIAATAVILVGGGIAVFFLLKKKKD